VRAIASILLLAALLAAATACLNDRDTLAAEVNRRPDVIWVIVGRFERNPPLYYEMRIKRIEAGLAKNPAKPDLYDDIAVAYDRIHQDENAIDWMGKKKALLLEMGPAASQIHDWYRYYANNGTFHAHHWFAKKSSNLDELHLAIQNISEALELNPNAHAGREGFQLAALQWLAWIHDPSDGDRMAFADCPYLTNAFKNHEEKTNIDGLAGLVRLGGAWESPDVYDALANLLEKSYRGDMLSQVAILRRDELVAKGIKPAGPLSELKWSADSDYASESKQEFERLRQDTEAWKQERDDFMLGRLKQGKHPDTDPDFWKGYVERPKPDLWRPPFWETIDWLSMVVLPFLCIGVPSLLAVWIVVRVVGAIRRKRLT
jgi:hypothetical protein